MTALSLSGRTWRLAALVSACVALSAVALPVSARALQAPDLYVRAGSHAAWMPLNGARLDTITTELGVMLQQTDAESNLQALVVTVTGVPNGWVDQRNWDGVRCQGGAGPAGSISSLGEFDYQGDGTYTVRVAAYTYEQGFAGACRYGPSSEGASSDGSFTVAARPTVELLGAPLFVNSSRSDRSTHGFRANGALGTTALDTTCGTDARMQPDGSLAAGHLMRESANGNGDLSATSAFYGERVFDRPGRWTCVSRAWGGYLIGHDAAAATPWSAPVTTLMREPFSLVPLRGALFPLAWRDRTPPRYAIAGKTRNALAAGGRVTLTLRPTPRCHIRHRAIINRATVRRGGLFRLGFRLPVPRLKGDPMHPHLTAPQRWTATLSFAGSRLILPGRTSIELDVELDTGYAAFPIYQGTGCL